jgi:hypothetical protein
MAGSSLFALLDDIAAMTKVAVRKTSGVLGDDLALNADQVAGVRADRELPVVWAVAKGSARNKLIIVPAAIAVSALAPWAIMPLLMVGGAYLCFEGFEKAVHGIRGKGKGHSGSGGAGQPVADPGIDPAESERKKIQGAIRTDLILSAEIIVIALGTVKDSSLAVQAAVVSGIAALMTIGVYGLVAMIVKLDDAGLLPRSKLGFEKADRAALSSPLHISNRGRSAERRGQPATPRQPATRLIVPLASMSCSCFRRFFS